VRRQPKRSRFLMASAAVLGAIGIVRGPVPAAQFVYKFGDPSPSSDPTTVRMVQMAAAIKAETQGRMEIQVFPDSQLGSPTSMLTQLREGVLPFIAVNRSIFTDIVPTAAIDSVGFTFTSTRQILAALDGGLGAYIRRELALKGMYVFEKCTDSGFRQVTSSTKQVRTVDDLAGFKIRIPPARIFVDLFKTLGASPVPLDSNGLYLALQTHIVDGQEASFANIETYKYYEVQKYLAITNHISSGSWLAANADAWNALPPDIQAVVKRNVAKYVLLQRSDFGTQNATFGDKLKSQGFVFNTANTATMRARLGPYYARWKSELGSTAWSLLEATVGKLA
jgi:TRAP-type transport system periplasmic protein